MPSAGIACSRPFRESDTPAAIKSSVSWGEGIVVVDESDQIIDLNPVIERAFDVQSAEAIGRPVDSVLGVDLWATQHGDSNEIESPGGQQRFEVTTSTITDGGNEIGHTFVFRDVTERETREQRLQVLNRVLRHNLRNDLDAITGYAEMLAEPERQASEYAEQIQTIARNLLGLGEKAREIESMVATQHERESDRLDRVIEDVIAEVQSDCPTCKIHVDSGADDQLVDGPTLRGVIRELVENACKHTDASACQVEITATVEPSRERPLVITVSDEGPGIPDHELKPVEEGGETPLEHGSGLGLWLVDWGVRTLNGEIEFETAEPRGTVATVRLPTPH